MATSVLSADALVTWAVMQNYLGAADAEQNEVEYAINAASAYANQVTRRQLAARDHTDYYDGNNSQVLLLDHWPINTSATCGISVYIDTERAYGSGTLVTTSDIAVYAAEGKLALEGDFFIRDYQAIKVIYNGGYSASAVPYDLQQAVKELAAWFYERGTKHRVGTTSFGGREATTSYEADIPKAVKAVLTQYKSYRGIGASYG